MQPEFIKMFIEEVLDEMKTQGISQIRLAEKMDVHRGGLNNLLRGRVNPSMITSQKIADALGMKIILCLGEIDD